VEASPRVYELAQELGISSRELLERLAALSRDPPRSASASVSPDLVDALRSSAAPGETDLVDEGVQLIQAAFDNARLSGREDWQRMTVAVLKNRLLTLTERQFTETHWGADSFREFVEMFPQIVELDRSTRPATARYLGEADEQVRTTTAGGRKEPSPSVHPRVRGADRRIRSDLWQAILDYSSGDVYVWDDGQAVGIPGGQLGDADDRPQLPTIDRATLANWRAGFAADLTGVPTDVSDIVRRWSEGRQPDAVLPRLIRRHWNGELKTHVLARLDEWFAERGIPEPSDIAESLEVAPGADATTERLRELVLRVIRGMSRAQLEELRLPPSALLRALDHDSS
jgi:hypothetical protein